jgi:hypothetical protein
MVALPGEAVLDLGAGGAVVLGGDQGIAAHCHLALPPRTATAAWAMHRSAPGGLAGRRTPAAPRSGSWPRAPAEHFGRGRQGVAEEVGGR